MFDESLARTVHGPVRGRVREDGVHVFKGIRYGADTRGHRFEPPRPPAGWTDVANAWEFGPTCPQDDPDVRFDRAQFPFLQMIGLTDNLPESEDCLFLNVWTPATRDGGQRPVMVWVHSGGYATNSGSSPSIDGAKLAAEGDVVVVTFNHRLNVFGYLHLGDHLGDDPDHPCARSGNAGMLDVVQVLQWVRDNAAEFGGDPGNVTVFGQSGGAMKISTLLGMPAARGLFHRAILSSGATPRVQTTAQAAVAAKELFAAAGTSDVEGLRELSTQDLLRAGRSVSARRGLTAFGAVADGVVVPDDPFEPRPSAVSFDVPVLVGDLDTEVALFTSVGSPDLPSLTEQGLAQRLAPLGEAAAGVVDAVRVSHPGASPYEVFLRIASGLVFTANAERLADRAASRAADGGAPAWRYRITWRTPVGDFLSPHEVDVALVFGNVDAAAGLNGGGADAHRLSELLRATWVAFARTGSPQNPLLPEWPAYASAERPVLAFGPEPRVVPDLDGPELRALRPLVDHPPVDSDWLNVLLFSNR
ncbi:carboxylesterase/lipase family protein [Kineococcus rhizosphaerae]|uniref:Carboxylic ester hydrolase n=1 Tax=Kineococcus rhizosphaerae TaxID=559628 RepID=A0A2T0R1X2_9ACTN|nr:carboxylesterase family protein [Kineococcus rhizosphaerae]PRY13562.1 para-nitrobenzyl esterase [Kineococcus rhizosphaerae]